MLLLRQGSHVPLQLVIYRFLDRRIVNRRVPFRIFPSLVCTFARFNIDKVFILQLPNVLGNRVGTHPGVLAYATDAGPTLMCFSILAENQVGVDRQLTGGKFQGEDLVGQKEKSPPTVFPFASLSHIFSVGLLPVFQIPFCEAFF